jgi:hypothetical protein
VGTGFVLGQKQVTRMCEGVSEVLGVWNSGHFLAVCPSASQEQIFSMTFIIGQDINSNLFVMVKLYLYRHGQAARIPGGWGSQIFIKSVHGGGKLVCPTNQPPSPPRKYVVFQVLVSVMRLSLPQAHGYEAESTPGPLLWGWVYPRATVMRQSRPQGHCYEAESTPGP